MTLSLDNNTYVFTSYEAQLNSTAEEEVQDPSYSGTNDLRHPPMPHTTDHQTHRQTPTPLRLKTAPIAARTATT